MTIFLRNDDSPFEVCYKVMRAMRKAKCRKQKRLQFMREAFQGFPLVVAQKYGINVRQFS